MKSKKQLNKEKQVKENIFKKSKTAKRKEALGIEDGPKRKKQRNANLQQIPVQNSEDVEDMLNGSDFEEKEGQQYDSSDEDSDILELEHKAHSASEVKVVGKMKDLLPIKTKSGVVARQREIKKMEKPVEIVEEDEDDEEMEVENEEKNEDIDSDIDVLEDVSKFLKYSCIIPK